MERRQKALELEIAQLEAQIEALEAALPKRAPVEPISVVGDQTPVEHVPFQVERRGERPVLQTPSVARTDSECGFRMELPQLKNISDYVLTTRGLGKASPLGVRTDGAVLAPHGTPSDFEKRCGAAFRHAGTVVLFAPETAPSGGHPEVEVFLDERFPLPREDGRPMYWLYPGQSMVIDLSEDLAVPSTAHLVAWVQEGSMTVRHSGSEESGSGTFTSSRTFTGGPIHIESRDAYVLIETLTIGSPARAAVITGETAWRSSH